MNFYLPLVTPPPRPPIIPTAVSLCLLLRLVMYILFRCVQRSMVKSSWWWPWLVVVFCWRKGSDRSASDPQENQSSNDYLWQGYEVGCQILLRRTCFRDMPITSRKTVMDKLRGRVGLTPIVKEVDLPYSNCHIEVVYFGAHAWFSSLLSYPELNENKNYIFQFVAPRLAGAMGNATIKNILCCILQGTSSILVSPRSWIVPMQSLLTSPSQKIPHGIPKSVKKPWHSRLLYITLRTLQ